MKKLFFFFIFSNILFSQERLFIDNQYLQTGIDYKNEKYLVFNNTYFYYSRDFKSKNWNKKEILFNEIPASKDFPYHFFHIKGKNYFTHKGCGTVYEFRNDSIIRIDNSFEHKSQFMASTFIYNDEIYYLGGYGLFTFKNILTKFDFNTREWELVKYSDYSNIPEPRNNSIIFIEKDILYLIGGYTENFATNTTTSDNKRLYDIWKLNLKTKQWNHLGELSNKNILLFSNLNYTISNQFYFDNGKLYQIDFENNKLFSSEPKDKYTFSILEQMNAKTNEIFYVLGNSNESKREFEVIVEDFDNYKSEFVTEEDLYQSKNVFQNVLLVLLSITIVVFTIYFFKKRRKPEQENKIILKDSVFYFKDKVINNLSNDEKDLLEFFFNNKSQPLPMNEVVDFFSKNDNTPYNTLTKKKDLVLNGLKQKLAFILEVEEDNLFVTQKNTEDKRIKEIQLNPRYF